MAVDLEIFGPWIGDANFPLEKRQDFFGVEKRIRGFGGIRWWHEYGERQSVQRVLQFGEFPAGQGDQVIHMRLILSPVSGDQSAAVARAADEGPVRDNLHFFRRMADDFAGKSFVGEIISRKPETMQLRFALRPQLSVACGVPHLRRSEIKSAVRRRRVRDHNRNLGAGGDRFAEGQDEFLLGGMMLL